MIRLFQSVINRVKAMFTLDAMLDLEQHFLTRHAERKAELIRAARRYQRQGMTGIAADLRRQAETLSEQRPLQTVLPFLESEPEARVPAAASSTDRRGHQNKPLQLPQPLTAAASRKKGT
jgi:hypothetical protein